MTRFEMFNIDRSDLEFLAVEIHFGGQRLCQVYRSEDIADKGLIKIEFLQNIYVLNDTVNMVFPISEFDRVLDQARELVEQRF